jgi:arginine deiminase
LTDHKEHLVSTLTDTTLGTHSEVGRLHTVMVHRPDLAHERLSPSNAHELLFDDVIWVRRARQEFDAFVDLMRSRGVEVLLLHELLAKTLEDADAREWLLSRRVRPEDVTVLFAQPMREWLGDMPADELATLIRNWRNLKVSAEASEYYFRSGALTNIFRELNLPSADVRN